MMAYVTFFCILLTLYYYRLNYVIHSLILLEFMSFYILSVFGLTGQLVLLGQYYIMIIFLVFVLEGVVGIISMVLFTNHSGASMIGLSSLK